jgi:hypothetical protein
MSTTTPYLEMGAGARLRITERRCVRVALVKLAPAGTPIGMSLAKMGMLWSSGTMDTTLSITLPTGNSAGHRVRSERSLMNANTLRITHSPAPALQAWDTSIVRVKDIDLFMKGLIYDG